MIEKVPFVKWMPATEMMMQKNDAKKQVWNMFKVTNKNSQRRSGDLLTDK